MIATCEGNLLCYEAARASADKNLDQTSYRAKTLTYSPRAERRDTQGAQHGYVLGSRHSSLIPQ